MHWADGGTSDPGNAALLCQRHHTTVHRRRLWAEVRTAPDDRGRWVVWDLADGSYDRALEHGHAERISDGPGGLPDRLLVAAIGPQPPEADPDLDRWWREVWTADPAWDAEAA